MVGAVVCAKAVQESHEVFAGFKTHNPAFGKPIPMDLTNASVSNLVRALHPDFVIHTGGLTDVDECERNADLAQLVNGTATGELAEAARVINAHFTYVSTDYVFDGREGSYDENAKPNPINEYGRSKYLGERLLTESGVDFAIARPSVIYGWGRYWKPNYALSVVRSLKEKRKVFAADDLFSSPTLNTQLADNLLELATRKLTGIYHVSGLSRISRLEFAREIAVHFTLDPTEIVRVNSSMLQLIAKRPQDSSLNVSKATKTLSSKLLPLSEALNLFQRTHPT